MLKNSETYEEFYDQMVDDYFLGHWFIKKVRKANLGKISEIITLFGCRYER